MWERGTAARLMGVLEGFGYTLDDCRKLAPLLYELPAGPPYREGDPHQLILQALGELQGASEEMAKVASKIVPQLNFSKLLVPSRVAADLLDVSRTSLMRYRESGQLEPAVEHTGASGMRTETMVYWLHELLRIVSSDRYLRHTSGGRGYSRFPE